jgi:hypothetical protein
MPHEEAQRKFPAVTGQPPGLDFWVDLAFRGYRSRADARRSPV